MTLNHGKQIAARPAGNIGDYQVSMWSARNMRYYKTISFKLTLFVSLLLILAMSVFTVLMVNKDASRQQALQKMEARVLAKSLATISRYPLRQKDYQSVHRIMAQAVRSPQIIEIQVSDDTGKRLIDVVHHEVDGVRSLNGRADLQLPVEPIEVITESQNTIVLWKPIILDQRLGWLKVTQALESESFIRQAVWLENLSVIFIIALAAVVLLQLFIRKPIASLRQYASFADHLESGSSKQLHIDQNTDEMKNLGSALQRASKRLCDQNAAINQAMPDLKSLAAFPVNSPTLEISMNVKGEIQYINPAGKKILHDLELRAEQFHVLMPADILQLIRQCLDTQVAVHDFEVEASGQIFQWTIVPIADHDLVHAYGKVVTSVKLADAKAHVLHTTAENDMHYSGHVLVAEDNINNRQLVNVYIRKLGAQATFANNGKIAVELAMKNDYDMILMDMQMPVMDGNEATCRLIESGCEIPIIALTANVMKEDRETYLRNGCVDILAKPIDSEQFIEVLSRYLCPREEALNPLYSYLLETEPAMQDLVDNFLSGLPEMFADIQEACYAEDWDQLSLLVHDMKSVGGGYGYPQLTDVSQRIEVALAKGNFMAVAGLMHELDSICKRILMVSKQGLPEQQLA